MNKISREQFKELKRNHYELWDWLSKNPDKQKKDWFELEQNKNKSVYKDCYACKFTLLISESSRNRCRFCPLCEGDNENCLDGLFDKWFCLILMNEPAARSECARQIRDLAWNKNNCLDYVV